MSADTPALLAERAARRDAETAVDAASEAASDAVDAMADGELDRAEMYLDEATHHLADAKKLRKETT